MRAQALPLLLLLGSMEDGPIRRPGFGIGFTQRLSASSRLSIWLQDFLLTGLSNRKRQKRSGGRFRALLCPPRHVPGNLGKPGWELSGVTSGVHGPRLLPTQVREYP